jgi:hypothetical protein
LEGCIVAQRPHNDGAVGSNGGSVGVTHGDEAPRSGGTLLTRRCQQPRRSMSAPITSLSKEQT